MALERGARYDVRGATLLTESAQSRGRLASYRCNHAPRTSHGFTLVELLVALTIAGSVAILAHRMFTGVADAAVRLDAMREALDREMNAQRVLIELAGNLEIGTAETAGFQGEPDAVSFTSWALGVEGWLSRRRVTLAARDSALIVSGLTDDPLALMRSVRRVGFDYLLEPGADEHWVRQWISPVSAPVAIRVRVERVERVDTLLLIVGPRG